MFIIVSITFIIDFEKVYLRREVSGISVYGQRCRETIHENKILNKAIMTQKLDI